MRPLHPIPAVILGLLLACTQGRGEQAAKDDEKLQAEALGFAKNYDTDWNKPLKELVEDVIKAVGGDEATKAALIEGGKLIAAQLKEHWRQVYVDYYLSHHTLTEGTSFWNEYPEMLAGEINLKGHHELTSRWEKLLRDKLPPGQLPVWEAEMKRRHERWPVAGAAWLKVRMAKLEKNAQQAYEARAAAIAEAAGMDKQRAEALKAAVSAAVEANMQVNRPYGGKAVRMWGEEFINYRESTLKSLENGTYAGYRSPVEAGWKAGQKAFDQVMDKVLRPEEHARKREFEDKDRQRIARIAKDMSVKVLQQAQMQEELVQGARLERMVAAVGMEEARRVEFKKRLAEAGKKIDEEWTQAFIVSVSKQIMERSKHPDGEQALKQMEQGRWWLSDAKADARAKVAREEAWRATVQAFIKPEETAAIAAAEHLYIGRRARVMALVAVAELDHRLLLLPEQREAIEKMALEAAKPVAELIMEIDQLWSQDLGGSMVLVHAIGLKKIEALLQEPQKKEFTKLAQACEDMWTTVQPMLNKKS